MKRLESEDELPSGFVPMDTLIYEIKKIRAAQIRQMQIDSGRARIQKRRSNSDKNHPSKVAASM